MRALEAPFQPPAMHYERKARAKPETAVVIKSQARMPTKAQQSKALKAALSAQEERFLAEIDAKQQTIRRQQEALARQHELLAAREDVQTLVREHAQRDKDFVQLGDVDKIRALAPEDRYNVLEYLIKEVMGLRKRKSSSSSSSSSSSKSSKKKKKKDKKKDKDKDEKKAKDKSKDKDKD